MTDITEEQRKRITSENARKAGKAAWEKLGYEHYAENARKAHQAKLKKYGPDYYKKIRAIGIQKRKEREMLKHAEELKAKTKKTAFDGLLNLLKGKTPT